MTPTINQFRYIAFLLCSVATFHAAGSSPLFTRGYTVIPEPQSVQLTGSDFQFGDGWRLVPRGGVQQDLTAVEILRDELASRHGIRLQMGSKPAPSSKTVLLEIRAGSVTIGSATDRDKENSPRRPTNSSFLRSPLPSLQTPLRACSMERRLCCN